MSIDRREFLAGATALALGATPALAAPSAGAGRHGLIGRIVATPGKREELAAILLEGTAAMPGCLSYVVAADPKDADALWVTEVWESGEAHAASLTIPAVRQAIARGLPMIAKFESVATTVPLGGVGLGAPPR